MIGRTFTETEQRARRRWQVANTIRQTIVESLLANTINPTRENLHKKPDKQLDRIEKLEGKALAEFSDVSNSFTICSFTIGKKQ